MVGHLLAPLSGLVLALAVAPQADAPIENLTLGEGIYLFHGSCNRLTTPQGDLTVGCAEALSHWVYPDGRTSYWFAQRGKALVTFSGLNEKVVGADGGVLIINKVTTSVGPQWHARGAPARGTCMIVNVQNGRVV